MVFLVNNILHQEIVVHSFLDVFIIEVFVYFNGVVFCLIMCTEDGGLFIIIQYVCLLSVYIYIYINDVYSVCVDV